MPPPKLEILSDRRDENGTPRLVVSRWHSGELRYVRVEIPVTEDELRKQLSEPIRLRNEPKFWLYRNRFVVEEGVTSEPDEKVALLETLYDPEPPTKEALAQVLKEKFPLIGSTNGFFHSNMVRLAMRGTFPLRHSALVLRTPNELVLRIKHKVLSEEKALDKLRREVEAFEAFEKLDRTSRQPIPQHVQMFVWQRDGGRCVKCESQERLEYDHIIPLAKGGSSTERNVQLLCESCNRSKGSTIS